MVGSSRNKTWGFETRAMAILQPTLHAAGILLHPLVRSLREGHHVHQFFGLRLGFLSSEAVEAGHQAEVLPGVEVLGDGCFLRRYVYDLLHGQRFPLDVVTHDRCGPARRPQQATQHLDGRRLAGAIRAENRKQLPSFDGQIQAIDRPKITKVPGEAGYLDGSTRWLAGIHQFLLTASPLDTGTNSALLGANDPPPQPCAPFANSFARA